jgi:glycosyltransferase involved in cell wall biosynthesis
LKIAVVSPFVDRRHGTERALAELMERLARDHACQIHLYSQRVESVALTAGARGSNANGAIVYHQVPSLGGPHLFKFIGWILANGFQRWFDRVFRGVSVDLVLSPGINCGNADVVIVHALFRRLQELSQGGEGVDLARAGLFRRLHRSVYYRLVTNMEWRVYSDQRVSLAAVSQRTSDLLARYFHRDDVRVISNGVDTREFCVAARQSRRKESRHRRGFGATDFVLLLIGNDWRVKGVPVVLRAMAAAPEVPLRLLVVGEDVVEPMRELASQLGVLDRCRWEKPTPDVIDLYAAADVYVSPSMEDSFGLPVAEAMACGLPAITSVYAGVSAQIHDGLDSFVLREPQDEKTLAPLLGRLYRDEGFRNQIGLAAARTVREWTWDRNAADVWDLLNTALAGKKSRT